MPIPASVLAMARLAQLTDAQRHTLLATASTEPQAQATCSILIMKFQGSDVVPKSQDDRGEFRIAVDTCACIMSGIKLQGVCVSILHHFALGTVNKFENAITRDEMFVFVRKSYTIVNKLRLHSKQALKASQIFYAAMQAADVFLPDVAHVVQTALHITEGRPVSLCLLTCRQVVV